MGKRTYKRRKSGGAAPSHAALAAAEALRQRWLQRAILAAATGAAVKASKTGVGRAVGRGLSSAGRHTAKLVSKAASGVATGARVARDVVMGDWFAPTPSPSPRTILEPHIAHRARLEADARLLDLARRHAYKCKRRDARDCATADRPDNRRHSWHPDTVSVEGWRTPREEYDNVLDAQGAEWEKKRRLRAATKAVKEGSPNSPRHLGRLLAEEAAEFDLIDAGAWRNYRAKSDGPKRVSGKKTRRRRRGGSRKNRKSRKH